MINSSLFYVWMTAPSLSVNGDFILYSDARTLLCNLPDLAISVNKGFRSVLIHFYWTKKKKAF